MNTTTETEAREIDTELAGIWNETYRTIDRIAMNNSSLFHLAGAEFYYRGRQRVTDMTVAEAREIVEPELARMRAAKEAAKADPNGENPWIGWNGPIAPYDLDRAESTIETANELRDELARLRDRGDELEARYDGWSRFFLVTSSAGHVHSSMSCSTCRATTRFGWLPSLSGKDESAAVDELGPTLCSVCFPSAPVGWTEGKKLTKAQAAKKVAGGSR